MCLLAVTPTASCVTDRDCRDPDKCDDGTCRDACSVDPCGANAICKSRGHASSCSCPIGYTGNPRVQCLKSKFNHHYCIIATSYSCTFCIYICSSDTRRTFQSRLTLSPCSPPSVGITPSVLCTPPASTGSASTPARSPTRAPPTPSAGLTITSLSARVRLATLETRGSSALNQNVSYFRNTVFSDICLHN